jgi:ABC-2 type transport system permease protein
MNFRIILNDFIADLKTWYRSKGTMFWTIVFPIMLILIFGAIFSGSQNASYDLWIHDEDNSMFSQGFIEGLSHTGYLTIKMETNISENTNISSFLKDHDIKFLINIPKDFGQKIQQSLMDSSTKVDIDYYFDPSEQTSNQVIQGIVSAVVEQMNMNITQGRTIIALKSKSLLSEEFSYIDFFLPGMIGFTIMQSAIYGTIERNTRFRKDGILRKLLTTPIKRTEWIFAKMLFMMFLSFITTVLIIIVGMLIYNLTVNINIFMLLIIIATSFLFSGMGMIIGRFVKDEESAATAGGAITFPMMFLAGTFFPLDQMPEFLQHFAKVLPLYYINEGLRNAMIYLKWDYALYYTVITVVFAAVFFIIGVFLTKWDED